MAKKRSDCKFFRNEIASQLDRLAELLVKEKVVNNAGPIYRAAHLCRSSGKDNQWEYRIERLVFHSIGAVRIQSHKIEYSEITLEVSLDIEGLCAPLENCDPLTKLEMNLLIQTNNGLMSCWHLDRFEGGKAQFLHPNYHFHFGGNRMLIEPHQYGSILITDAPRIPHPPMDGVLGIDFALVNFWEAERLKFRNKGEYTNILKSSLERLWKPYMVNLYQFWQPNAHLLTWKPCESWPQLLSQSS
jgi:hypothetical protein